VRRQLSPGAAPAHASAAVECELIAAAIAVSIGEDYCDDYIARSLTQEEVGVRFGGIDWDALWMGFDLDDAWPDKCSCYRIGALARTIYEHDR
jgi:hypothetical protein